MLFVILSGLVYSKSTYISVFNSRHIKMYFNCVIRFRRMPQFCS